MVKATSKTDVAFTIPEYARMNEKQAFFITGTDTDAGKTVITCGLLEKARQHGMSTAAIKPVASGCEETSGGLRNSDALALAAATTLSLPYNEINPVALKPAIAPHIAAEKSGIILSPEHLASQCRNVLKHRADLTLIEGAGGWRVPLENQGGTWLSDLPRILQLPVILVVNMRLGCINHAVLTAETIIRDGVQIAGWVANRTHTAMENFEENLATLKNILPAHCMGSVPCLDTPRPDRVAEYLSLEKH